jgi:hypothetical protein
LFVQAAHQKVDLVMQLPIWMILPTLAAGASTGSNDAIGHDEPP